MGAFAFCLEGAMALINRIQHPGIDPETAIPIHKFTAAMTLWASGEITRQNVIDKWVISVGDQAGLDTLKTAIDALGTVQLKVQWLNKLECAGLFYEDGTITADKYKSIMGLS
jgi:hypothetical protein